jgi:short-subunit dehydrogenase
LKPTALIIGVSSDIGLALSKHWASRGYDVVGTYRTRSKELELTKDIFYHLFSCDFEDENSIDILVDKLKKCEISWDVLVICPGTMNPIGPFSDCNFEEWRRGILINFISPMQIVHKILKYKSKSETLPLIVFFAGGGVNSSPKNYTSYTISKIALIKAVEMLDAEMNDLRVSIIGPGWVNTKIHQETLRAGTRAIDSAKETQRRINSMEFNPMERVLQCLDWLMRSPKEVIGGRNISVVHDNWGKQDLEQSLMLDNDKFKLRRFGNN